MMGQMTKNMIEHLAKAHDPEVDPLDVDVFNHLKTWSLEDRVELCTELDVKINQHNYYLFERSSEYTISELIETVSVAALSLEVSKKIKEQSHG
ncbi:hypothetical protein SIPHO059v1_p0065 [Vibrio phage 264E42.1]|nr:hypothetical protein SIPHO059v1_p0065 [Vibrio phage 264E42.1]